MNIQNVEFIKSATDPASFIRDGRPNIVFAGKSNVGKSSVINRLLNRKNFARVGAQPGKTIHVNYFLVDRAVYFTDLPGYGFAKVSKEERARWGNLMEAFFSEKELISLGVLIVDSRHKPTEDDCTMAAWFQSSGNPFLILANKIDKVKKSELNSNIEMIRSSLNIDESTLVIPFSAEKGDGRDQLLSTILQYC